jgi:hypothetical protein
MAATPTLSIPDLIGIITECETRMTVMVPSTDYYRRQGDTDEETITFVNSYLLIEKLTEMYNSNRDYV